MVRDEARTKTVVNRMSYHHGGGRINGLRFHAVIQRLGLNQGADQIQSISSQTADKSIARKRTLTGLKC